MIQLGVEKKNITTQWKDIWSTLVNGHRLPYDNEGRGNTVPSFVSWMK